MMYRAGWASKAGQERILAIRLPRAFFDELLLAAVPSSYNSSRYATHEEWQRHVETSEVRLQWDPDHDPIGRPLERRAIQLGLRGEALRRYGTAELMSVTDITEFVVEQRNHLVGDFKQLDVPHEQVYSPAPAAAQAVGLDT